MGFFTAWTTKNPSNGGQFQEGASGLIMYNTDRVDSTTIASQPGHSTWTQFVVQTLPPGTSGLAKVKATLAAVRGQFGASQI